MKKIFFRSVVVMGLVMLSVGMSSAFDVTPLKQLNRDAGTLSSQIGSGIDQAGQGALGFVQGAPRVIGQGLEDAAQTSDTGKGFYMSIYKNVVVEPNEMMKEELSQRFGLDFKISLQPKALTGQKTFVSLYDSPADGYSPQYIPELTNTLDESCARIQAGVIDQEARRMDLLFARLQDKKIFAEKKTVKPEPTQDELDIAAVNRLIQSFPAVKEGFVQELVKNIPQGNQLDEQSVLLDCDREIRDAVDFEMRLQQLLHPHRKQLEILQTFMNGKLEDFEGLPRYDLLLDIDVIESVFFGTGVSSGDTGGKNTEEKKRKDEALEVFRDVVDSTVAELPGSGVATGVGSQSFVRALLDPFENAFLGKISGESTTLGFGKRSSASAGPLCPDQAGLGLDFSTIGKTNDVQNRDLGTLEDIAASRAAEIIRQDAVDLDIDLQERVAQRLANPVVENGQLQEGKQTALNAQSVCQGNTGFDFGNQLIRMVFCLSIEFNKVGKTWKVVRDDCISCHIAKMNQVFEEMLLNKSVRPHKNTGTIMESALCEDAYGNDVGFFSFIEWVPVKFYPDICYPEGGITNEGTARLTGYPELVSKLEQSGNSVDCRTLESDEAKDTCRDALVFTNTMSSSEYDGAYLIKDDRWKRLVGERGEVERELHEFLVRLGKAEPRHGEEAILFDDEKKHYQKRRECLAQRIHLIQTSSLPVSTLEDQKTLQLLVVKGYSNADIQPGLVPEGCDAVDTVSTLEKDITDERNRVMKEAARFNQAARDFNRNSSCGPFSDPGLLDQLVDFAENRVISGSYYIDTEFRATQTPQEKVSGQILDNTDITDIDVLLNEIGQAVENNQESLKEEQNKRVFQMMQEKSQVLPSALGQELNSLRTNLQSFTDWWSEMVDKKQFVDESGTRINALESFTKKVRR
ncbi:MAG: hypothetical protein P1V18_05655 [Candidatus Gracilibacteria bacterium]|nr:hypothetical protein [Candidatus Gracilibacteria bacterium]